MHTTYHSLSNAEIGKLGSWIAAHVHKIQDWKRDITDLIWYLQEPNKNQNKFEC